MVAIIYNGKSIDDLAAMNMIMQLCTRCRACTLTSDLRHSLAIFMVWGALMKCTLLHSLCLPSGQCSLDC